MQIYSDLEIIEEPELNRKAVYSVAIYEIDRRYGGPEEGGWWYDSGELVYISKAGMTMDAAYDYARRFNNKLRYFQRNRRSVGSVIYNGGRFSAQVYISPPERYPTVRPHYE